MTDKCFRALMKIASGAYGTARLNPPPTPPEPTKKPAATSNKENKPAANDEGFQPEPNWIQRYLNKKSVPKTAAAPTSRKTAPIAAPRLFSAVGTDIDGESANRWLTYDVQKGDNPTVIAKRLGVPLAPFMQWNNLNEQTARRLQIGQQLRYLNPAYLGK